MAETFVQETPEYLANESNGAKMQAQLKKMGFGAGKRMTVGDLRQAFESIKDVLEAKPEPFDPYTASLDEIREKVGAPPSADVENTGWEW